MKRFNRFSLGLFFVTISVCETRAENCDFLDRAQSVVAADLGQRQAVEKFQWKDMAQRPDIGMAFSYQDDAGTPRVIQWAGVPTIIMPRGYFLDVMAWTDALIVCQLDSANCKGLELYAEAFSSQNNLKQLLFRPTISSERPEACGLRGTKAYSTALQGRYLSAMLAIQAHESAHIILGHLDSDSADNSSKLEAHADAFAYHILSLMEGEAGLRPDLAASGLLPLVRKIFQSERHPDVACRVARFGASFLLKEQNGSSICESYNQNFEEGLVLSRQILGPKAYLVATP